MQRSVDLPSQYAFRSPADIQRCGGRPWWEWSLLIITLTNVGSLLGLSAADFPSTLNDYNGTIPAQTVNFGPFPASLISDIGTNPNPAFTFDLVMLVASVFIGLEMLYGFFARKKYELIVCPMMLAIVVAFAIVEYAANTDNRNSIKLVRVIMCSALVVVSVPLTIRTVDEDYWTEFQITGASDGLMGMYRRLWYFNALLKFDAFLIVLLGMFSLVYGQQSTSTQAGFLCFFILYAIVCVAIGSFAVNLELKRLVFFFVVLSMFLPLLIPFQVVSFKCIGFTENIECASMIKLGTWCAISVAILVLILRTYIILVLLQVYRHFGYGLTDAAFAGLIANESTSLLGRQRRLY